MRALFDQIYYSEALEWEWMVVMSDKKNMKGERGGKSILILHLFRRILCSYIING